MKYLKTCEDNNKYRKCDSVVLIKHGKDTIRNGFEINNVYNIIWFDNLYYHDYFITNNDCYEENFSIGKYAYVELDQVRKATKLEQKAKKYNL